MIKFWIISLLPAVIDHYVNQSIIKQAQNKKLVKIYPVNLRDYANNHYQQVDDYQYGGGAGMVLMIEPIINALKGLGYQNKQVWLLSPRGKVWTQSLATTYSQSKNLEVIIVCGHYEGIDERINQYVHHYFSIGDFVLTSGILVSLTIIDSIIRLIPGVINQDSLVSESFNDDLLDHPVYTKPQVFQNQSVPDVLLSGNHQNIAHYRLAERIRITKKFRPDLYQQFLKKNSPK